MTTRITPTQAQKCPKCNVPGTIMSTSMQRDPQGRAGRLHVMKCENIKCNWWNTNWVVQEDGDGMVLVRDTGHEPKSFPKLRNVLTQAEASALIDAQTQELVDPRDVPRVP